MPMARVEIRIAPAMNPTRSGDESLRVGFQATDTRLKWRQQPLR